MKAKSWHGRLALHYGPLQLYDLQDIDICTYTRAVFKGIWAAAWVTVGLSILGLLLLSTVFNVYFYLAWGLNLQVGNDVFAAVGIILPAIILLVAGGCAWAFAAQCFNGWVRAKRSETDSFISKYIEARKHGYCFKLNFSDVARRM